MLRNHEFFSSMFQSSLQVSENLGRNHAELLKNRSRRGGIAKGIINQETVLSSRIIVGQSI
jgi:hypothetical protein